MNTQDTHKIRIAIASAPLASPRTKLKLIDNVIKDVIDIFGEYPLIYRNDNIEPSLLNCSENMKKIIGDFVSSDDTHLLFLEDDVRLSKLLPETIDVLLKDNVNYVTFYLPGLSPYPEPIKNSIKTGTFNSEDHNRVYNIKIKYWYGSQCILIPKYVARLSLVNWVDGQAVDVTLKKLWGEYSIFPVAYIPNLAQHIGIYANRSGYRKGYTRHTSLTFKAEHNDTPDRI